VKQTAEENPKPKSKQLEKSVSAGSHNISRGLSLRANVSWTFVGNVINAASWLGMTIVLARLGSPEHVGRFALGLATTAPIFMFATLRLRDVQATDAKQEYLFGHYLALRLTTTFVAILTTLGVVFVSRFSLEMSLIIIAMAASKAVESIADSFYGFFMRQERLDRVAKSLMAKGPLSLVGLGTVFYATGSVFWGVIALVAVRLVILVCYDLRNVKLSFAPPSRVEEGTIATSMPAPIWDPQTLARLFWLALPLGFVTMLISFNVNLPRYFVEGYLGSYQLGVFAVIASFQKVAPTVVQAIGRSAAPRLSDYFAKKNVEAFRKLATKLIGIAVLLGGGGVVIALVAGRSILTLIYGPEYALSTLFAMVMLAAGLDYIAAILVFVITSARYFRVQLPIHVLTTGAIGLTCYLLIPSLGLYGAAWALIIGYSVRVCSSLVVALYALRVLKVETDMSPTRFEPVNERVERCISNL
jgi:O-antigen/teichoic acid export membrane protein